MGAEFSGDTTGAPLSTGNPTTMCGSGTSCINGCRSDFYRVTGGAGGRIQATTCRDAATTTFDSRIYVWQGSSAVCSTFSCINGTGTYQAQREGGGERRLPETLTWAHWSLLRSHSPTRATTAAGSGNCPSGMVGADLAFTAVPGAEYIVQVTGDSAADFGLYDLGLYNLESNYFNATKVAGTYLPPYSGEGGHWHRSFRLFAHSLRSAPPPPWLACNPAAATTKPTRFPTKAPADLCAAKKMKKKGAAKQCKMKKKQMMMM
jgi:hypothetical protein